MNLKKQFYCFLCGTKLINVKDTITKKISPYLWKCPNNCHKDLRLSIG